MFVIDSNDRDHRIEELVHDELSELVFSQEDQNSVIPRQYLYQWLTSRILSGMSIQWTLKEEKIDTRDL